MTLRSNQFYSCRMPMSAEDNAEGQNGRQRDNGICYLGGSVVLGLMTGA
jgi:hypothetical protein